MEIDDKGYPRDKDGRLIHRNIAYRKYKSNPSKYPMPFSKYQVHHKDGNKKNFRKENLQIVTPSEHRDIHEISNPVDDYYSIAGLFAFFYSFIVSVFISVLIYELNLGIEKVIVLGIVTFFVSLYLMVKYIDTDKMFGWGLVFLLSIVIGGLSGFFFLNFAVWAIVSSIVFVIGTLIVFRPRIKSILWFLLVVLVLVICYVGIAVYPYLHFLSQPNPSTISQISSDLTNDKYASACISKCKELQADNRFIAEQKLYADNYNGAILAKSDLNYSGYELIPQNQNTINCLCGKITKTIRAP